MTLPELSADKSIQYATSVGLGAYLDATKLIFSCLIIIFLRFYSILHYSGCYQVLYCYDSSHKANTCLRNLPSLYDT
nr:MAG TPA: hypothetical protein [Caudoviricetes sp.]